MIARTNKVSDFRKPTLGNLWHTRLQPEVWHILAYLHTCTPAHHLQPVLGSYTAYGGTRQAW